MNKKSLLLPVAAAILAMSAPAQAENVIIPKIGGYAMSDTSQMVWTDDWYGYETAKFDDGGSFAIEYEYRFDSGFSIGGEYFVFGNDFIGNWGTDGTITSAILALHAKKYFYPTHWLLPYIGVGLGVTGTVVDTDYTNESYGGGAFQLMGGVEFNFNHVGIYTELKSTSTEVENDYGDTIDHSGTSLSVGLAIHF